MSQPPNTTSSSDASGTKSLMSGERPSVRLPSRTVPIWVNDPIGLASPRRIASTPAIVVVLTAPMPTSMIPSFPVASAIFAGFFTTADYIIVTRRTGRAPVRRRSPERAPTSRDMPWLKKDSSEPLTVAMTGIKLGDRVLIAGVSDTALITALGIKAGLTGRTCIVDSGEREVAAAAAAIERNGALVESAVSPLTTLPYESRSFDVAVLRDVLGPARPEDRAAIAAQ